MKCMYKSEPNSAIKFAARNNLLLLILCMVFIGACETSVDPFIDDDRFFTIFGSLDTKLDDQFIRVIPVRQTFELDPSNLQASLKSTDLTTGEERVWNDSLVTLNDGSTGLIFTSHFRVRAGHTYKIEVSDEQGRTTSATTTMPSAIVGEVRDATLTSDHDSVFPTGSQDIIWRGLDREPFEIELWYRYMTLEDQPFRDVMITQGTTNYLGGDQGDWVTHINYTTNNRDLSDLVANLGQRLAGMGMTVVVLSEDWVAPGGVFDPEILVQPGTFSNVENGYGFIGSTGRFSVEWVFPE